MERHLRRVALLHGLLALLGLLGASSLLLTLPAAELRGPVALLRALGWAGVGLGVLGLLAARGLTKGDGWARLVAIVLGALLLASPVVGTAVGLYTLWTLLSEAGAKAFVDMTRVKLYDQAPGFGGGAVRPAGMTSGACCGLFVLWLLLSALALAPAFFVVDLRPLIGRLRPSPATGGAPADPGATDGASGAEGAPTDAPPPPSRAKRARPVEGLHGVYTYTDDEGKVHVTQDYWSIPARYR